jgi:hypothetical protein
MKPTLPAALFALHQLVYVCGVYAEHAKAEESAKDYALRHVSLLASSPISEYLKMPTWRIDGH